MKKIFMCFLALCLLVVLCSCGSQEELTPIEKAQQRAVEIGEQFLDYELTREEAREQLDSILVPETEGNGQVYLEADINYLSFLLLKNDSSYEDIKDRVEDIKNFTYE